MPLFANPLTGSYGGPPVVTTRAYRLRQYGPVAPLTLVGPLRPSDVKQNQGLQFDEPSTQRLLLPLPAGGIVSPFTACAWFRPSATPTGTRGVLTLRDNAQAAVVEVTYTATSVQVVGGPSVPLALVEGDVAFVAVTSGPAGIVLYAGRQGAALVSSTGGTAVTATLRSVDVGLAGGARTGGAVEQVIVRRGQGTAADLGELFLSAAHTFADSPVNVLVALSVDSPTVNALTSDGLGLLAVVSTLAPATVEGLEVGGGYTPNGATTLITTGPSSGVLVADLLRVDSGALLQVVQVVTSSTRDEVYAGPVL